MQINRWLVVITCLWFWVDATEAKERMVKINDVVVLIKNIDQGKKVHFAKHAGIYYLKQNNPNYQGILKELEGSQKTGRPVSVNAEETYLEIKELAK
jgi:hypothetical protein